MSYQNIVVETKGRVGIIRLNRPQALNALNKALIDELSRNFGVLKQKADPAPYFMGYAITETEGDEIQASRGSLDGQQHVHQRLLDVTVRAGDPNWVAATAWIATPAAALAGFQAGIGLLAFAGRS